MLSVRAAAQNKDTRERHGKRKRAGKNGPTGWHQELAYFVDCVRKGVTPTKYQTIASIADTMKIVFAEEKSAKEGKCIKL